jgi:CRP/FNR family transcriptional regulator/CRP/FNR family cyclic AMP-dependent transcriptional regulator
MTGAHFLHNVSLFADVSIGQLEPLAQRLAARKYKTEEPIFSQGSPGNSLYIVKTGRVAITVTAADGSTHTIAEFGPGQCFGEFALLDGLPRSAAAVARERSELLILTRPEFFMFLEQHPAVAIQLLVLLSRRLRFTIQQAEHEHLARVPTTQLAHILTHIAERYGTRDDGSTELAIRLTLGELAGLMGCTRSETEQAMETLQESGLVTVHGTQMTIPDLAKLRAQGVSG